MDDRTVRINELRLCVTGLSIEEGRMLGEEVVRAVSEGLPQDVRNRELGALKLRVKIPAGTAHGDIAEIVGKRISGVLK